MPLDQLRLENLIVTTMEAEGANAEGEFSWVRKLAKAISSAVVSEITSNAVADVESGSSAGKWKIE